MNIGAAARDWLVRARCWCRRCSPSSSLFNDLGRDPRVQAKPLRARFASLDTAATAKGRQLRGDGGAETRMPGPVPVNGSVNGTRRDRPDRERQANVEAMRDSRSPS